MYQRLDISGVGIIPGKGSAKFLETDTRKCLNSIFQSCGQAIIQGRAKKRKPLKFRRDRFFLFSLGRKTYRQ